MQYKVGLMRKSTGKKTNEHPFTLSTKAMIICHQAFARLDFLFTSREKISSSPPGRRRSRSNYTASNKTHNSKGACDDSHANHTICI